MKLARIAAAAVLVAALPAAARTPPSAMMANVYRLTQASAVLAICFDSAEFKALASDRASELRDLNARLGDLIQGIAGHYRDDSLYVVYENTRRHIASSGSLRLHVKNHYQYCGERLASEMGKYVAENEALINGWLEKQRPPPRITDAPR